MDILDEISKLFEDVNFMLARVLFIDECSPLFSFTELEK